MPPERHLTLAAPPDALLQAASDELEVIDDDDLENEELRLLARYATGDHLPVEIRDRVARLRHRRTRGERR